MASKLVKPISIIACSMMLLACAGKEDTASSKIIATVNNKDVAESQFNAYLNLKKISQDNKDLVKQHLDQYLERMALADSIVASGALDNEMIAVEVDEFRKQSLISRYFEKVLDEKVTEQAIKNYYAQNQDKYQTKKINVSHILVRTNPKMTQVEKQAALTKAMDIYGKAISGTAFNELAEQHSEDEVSGKKGGNLGWIIQGAIDPAFSQKAFSLGVGEISEPFATNFGYHIIKVEEPATVVQQAYEKVKGDIRYILRQEVKQAEMERLKGKVEIVNP